MDGAIPSNRNLAEKEAKGTFKYKDIMTDISDTSNY
jgi:hypothetical protein